MHTRFGGAGGGIARLLNPPPLLDPEPEECSHPAKRIEPISRLKL